jgi:hypothetical protein
MMRLGSLGIAIVAVGLSGCFLVETAANSAGIPSPAKVVADKAPPDMLIATDGTTCMVPRSRYDRVRIGQSITCVWTGTP